MVLGLLVIAGIPTTIGVAEGISQSKKQKKEQEDERYLERFTLETFCEGSSRRASELHKKPVVLRDGKLWVDTGRGGHRFDGFYIQYPLQLKDGSGPPRGLVSTKQPDPPMLIWIYADSATGALQCGTKSESIEHVVGPWDWTEEDEEGVTLRGGEDFVAIEERPGEWAIYFEPEGFKAGGDAYGKKKKLELSLNRIMKDTNEPPKGPRFKLIDKT